MNQRTSPRIRRRESPPVMRGRTGYRNAEPHLRRDFGFRCAYCGVYEQIKGGPQAFCIDHFKPQSKGGLELHLEIPFVVARSGDQPRGDARSMSSDVSMQAKRYTGENPPNAKTIEGDIRGTIRESPHLQVYVLAVTRDTEQLSHTLDAIARETGLDIVPLELSDGLSELGTLCVTCWKDICPFFESSDHYDEFKHRPASLTQRGR